MNHRLSHPLPSVSALTEHRYQEAIEHLNELTDLKNKLESPTLLHTYDLLARNLKPLVGNDREMQGRLLSFYQEAIAIADNLGWDQSQYAHLLTAADELSESIQTSRQLFPDKSP